MASNGRSSGRENVTPVCYRNLQVSKKLYSPEFVTHLQVRRREGFERNFHYPRYTHTRARCGISPQKIFSLAKNLLPNVGIVCHCNGLRRFLNVEKWG
jgi:hypothetical protein